MKRIVIFCLTILMAISLAGCSGAQDYAQNTQSPESEVSAKRVAYIMQMAPSDIFETWSEAAEKTANSLGMEYQAFFCGGSDSEWQDTIAQCAADGYDGLLLSHGGKDYSYTFLTEILQQYPDLKIVTFDTLFEDGEGQTQKIDGVTQFFQQDAKLSELLLEYITETLYPEKIAAGEPVNILKVWAGPDYLSAFDRREEGYSRYEQEGLIRTVETIAPSDLTDAEASMTETAAAALAKYSDGDIDAVWCCYDLYAAGVYAALTDSGYNIPMVSVDICNADIEKMAQSGSPWKACATTNWYNNGEFGMRVLALELTGEYEKIVDPMTGETADWLELPAYLVTQDMVSGGGITIENLDTVAGAEYSERSWMPSSEWMTGLLAE